MFAVDSPARVFFLNNRIPDPIFGLLQQWVEPIEIKYHPVKRTTEQTTRIYGMAQLLIAAKLTNATDGTLVPGSKVKAFLRDDELLRLELMNSKQIRKHMVNELQYAFEIDSFAASKVKKEIEKRSYFCEMGM